MVPNMNFSTHFYSSFHREISSARSSPSDINYTSELLSGGKVSEPSKPKMRKKGIVWQQLGPPTDTLQEEDTSIKVHTARMHNIICFHHRKLFPACAV